MSVTMSSIFASKKSGGSMVETRDEPVGETLELGGDAAESMRKISAQCPWALLKYF
jgi:hypothetical protein